MIDSDVEDSLPWYILWNISYSWSFCWHSSMSVWRKFPALVALIHLLTLLLQDSIHAAVVTWWWPRLSFVRHESESQILRWIHTLYLEMQGCSSFCLAFAIIESLKADTECLIVMPKTCLLIVMNVVCKCCMSSYSSWSLTTGIQMCCK